MVHRKPVSLRALSFPRWLNNTRLFLHRWLRHWHGLVGREALSRLRRRRSILLSLEGLEDRTLLSGGPILDLAGFTANTLPANDDASTGLVNLGFTITFGGKSYSSLYVNDNGNVTFGGAMSTYTPYNLVSVGQPIIAPFFADVDTRDDNLVSYGTDTVDGHAAFGVDWFNVNYFNVLASGHVNKYNTFQLVLIDRSDLQPGDFDIEFNYGGISWETGDVSGGVNGLGGDSAFVGYSDGTGSSGNWYQFAGSGVPGSFLDSNTGTGLVYNSLNSGVTGRYVFGIRQSNSITTADASVVSPAPGQPVTLLATVAAAVPGSDTLTGTVTFSEGSTNLGTATLQDGVARLTLPDGLALGTHTITAVYDGDANFTGSQGSESLVVKDPAKYVPGTNCNCGCPDEAGDLVAEPADEEAPAPDEFSERPVRYADGVINIAQTDLHSDGFGYPWGQTRSWSNGGGYSNGVNGNGWVDTYTPPQLIQANGSTSNTLIAVANGTTAYYFTLVNGVYQSSFGEQSQLIYNSSNDTYTLIDGEGDQIVFDGFGSSWSSAQRGQFASYTSSDGVKMTASDNINGQIAEMQRSAGGVTQTWVYSYLPSTDRNAGLLSNVELLDSSGNIVRQVQYAYYDGTQTYGGNLGDLMTATVADASGNALSTDYYRYYTAGEANGYKHGLKYVFNGASYERLTSALGTNLAALTDAQVAPYADNYFQYDSSQRVTQEVAQGAGDSQTSGGLGTYTFSYTTSTNTPGYNSWQTKTVVTNPDGSTDTVYTNTYGQVMLDDHYDPSSALHTDNFYAYNTNGQLTLAAEPSAISGYSDTYADLLNNVNGSYQYLNNSSGLISRYDYYTTTTATETTAGGVVNYLQDQKIQQGQSGTLIPQETWQYYAHSYNGQTIAPIANDTVYRNTDGTGAETTSYSYTWYTNSAQIQSQTVTAPVISASENGPGGTAADVTTIYYDQYGNAQWTKDPDGYIQYDAYDSATGALLTDIVDVNTADSSEFTNLPSGWSTFSGGGLNLVTQDQVDALGRTTKETSPAGNITYYVYLDPQHEERIYQGWNSSSGTATLPTEVIREDSSGTYTEELTMTAAPHLTNGAPDGSEAIGNVISLTRDYVNAAGQLTSEYAYNYLYGLTYSTGTMGTVNTNYYQTNYDYDSDGRLVRTQTPNGTIYRTVYNSLGEAVSAWVGTNDTPTSGEWSPTNNTGSANMVEVSSYQYDNGSVGDGNLTQETDYPGLGAANRVTDYWYDWRDRLVAQKSGVESSENDGVNRPILVTTYDNLDEVTETQQYVGDGVTPTISNGVLQALPASDLRAQEIDSYDDQGRLYQTQVYDVNPSTGAVSSTALTTNYYYDHRGDLMAESDPGGLWTKSSYDGAGRDVMDYTTDGAGGTTWSAASSVANDTVLEQVQTVYDADSNPIETIDSQRFHNATGTGALGSPTSGIGARVYYAAAYYDNVDRVIADVDAGTNGGTAWTRPGTVPSSSPTLLVTTYAYYTWAFGRYVEVHDPLGIATLYNYDNLGRLTRIIENFTGQAETTQSDVSTSYYYDGNDNVTYVQANEPGGAYQETRYVYGVTTASGSGVNSNDILSVIQHPDPSTGHPSVTQQDKYLTDALGDVVQSTDRKGNVHQYSYDVLGRLTSDAVTTLGTGVDGTIRRIQYAYDSQGNNSLVTSYNAASGGSIVNQVQRVYNGLGQLTGEYQSHSGAVVQGTTPEVQYAYTEMSGGQNNSRLTSMTYPSAYVLNFNYNTGLDSNISRLSSISDSGGTLEQLKYLGLDTIVERDHPQNNVNLSYIKQSGDTQYNSDGGDQYTGLDRFGRVIDQNWVNATTSTSTDRFQYGYDQDSDVLYRQNLVDAVMSELYTYDNLNQLASFQRGTLNSTKHGISGTPSRSQSWTPDALGNFTGVTTNGTTQTRTANQQNEYSSISGSGTITYDANGNITADGSGNTYVYDAWNRLVAVKNGSTTLAAYSYDGLNRRTTETHGSTTTDLYYSANWQVLEERNNGQLQARYVWSPAGVDTLVLRDDSSQNNGVLDRRLYVQQDILGNVTSLVNTSGNVVERYAYDPYGVVTVLNPDFSARGASSYNWTYLYQGKRYDGAVGLYDSRERVDSPTLMRPSQADPLGLTPDSNYYRWVGNNPTNGLDPFGLFDAWEFSKGLLSGGGQGIADFFGGIWNMVWHPYDSVVGIYNGITSLIGHLANFEWDEATKQVFPELYQLATEWNNLSDYDKGYLIGKVVGQYGAGIATGAGIAKILKQLKALKAGKSTVKPKSCFPAGTPVATSEGLRPIETIEVGDLVWAYDLVSSQWRLCRVKRPYDLSYKGTFVYTTVGGETIASTYRHPYWVVRGEDLSSRPWLEHLAFIPKEATTPGRWVDSADLRVGDEVLLRDGRIVPVERVEFGQFEGIVYNMEVEELQCYTVGQNSVLVHNNNSPQTGPGNPAPAPKPPKEILDQLPGKTGKTGPIKQVPNEQALNDLFDTLTKEGKPVNPGAYPGEVMELPDGTIVRKRPSSKSGGATLDITLPGGEICKVHIK